MNVQDVEKLVAELLATGEMNEDTVADLGRIEAEARAGTSHADDLDYLRALHGRVLSSAGISEIGNGIGAEEAPDLRAENERLRAELAEAQRTIAELRAQLTPQA